MLKKRIIPCLDVKDGRVVKGVNFVKLRDAGDPADCARAYADQGADEIAFLDITASTDGRKPLVKVVERTARHLFVPLTVGGGIKGIGDIRDLLNAGADKITLNTMAVMTPDIITQASGRFGSQCIVVAIDAKRTTKNFASAHEVYTHGGAKTAGMDALEWAERAVKHGCGEILLTSIDRDGTREGYNLELTRLIADKVGVPVIASGGVGTLQHFYEGLSLGRASAVLAASVFHFGEFTIPEVKKYLHGRKVPVRLEKGSAS